jgi:hypothetical protein
LTLSLFYNSATNVTLSGTVTDIDVGAESVHFTGVASGDATCDYSGHFTLNTTVSGLGAIDATVTNLWGQVSNTAEVNVTAPPSVTINTQVNAGRTVVLSGTVTGDHAAGAMVMFSGAFNGSTMADSNGNYSCTTTSASMGTVSVTAIDTAYRSSAPASAQISVTAPTITLAITEVCQDHVVLSGHIAGADASGAMVMMMGAKQGAFSADANGNFSFTMTLSEFGTVSVVTYDSWAQMSNVAQVAAASFPPIIQNFTASYQGDGQWRLSGSVAASNLQGITINFGGLGSLMGRSVSVGSDGNFELVVELQGETGSASAQATKGDLVSNLAECEVS